MTYSLPEGTHKGLASPDNRGYALMFRQERFRKATAQQMYVTDRPLVPEAIIELTPEAWTGPPLADLSIKPSTKRDHKPFGYEYEGEAHTFDGAPPKSEKPFFTATSTEAPRLAPCASGPHVRFPRDPGWVPDVEWRKDALTQLGDKPQPTRRLWMPGTPPPPWPANQADRAAARVAK